jgi:hypothetical protein
MTAKAINLNYPFGPETEKETIIARLKTLEDRIFADIEASIEAGDLSAISVAYGTTGFSTDEEHVEDLATVLANTREGRGYGDARTAMYHVFTRGADGVCVAVTTGNGPNSEARAEYLALMFQWALISRYVERHPEVGGDGHASDCATHNEPAYPNGPCDCGAEQTNTSSPA